MSSYVYNKVKCSKEFFEKYFNDPNPFGEEVLSDLARNNRYISFRKIHSCNSIEECQKKTGNYISYWAWYGIEDIGNGAIEVKFLTRTFYPIKTILKAIELDHSLEWCCAHEEEYYISKFCWSDGKVVEYTLFSCDAFEKAFEESYERVYRAYKDGGIGEEVTFDDYDDWAWHLDFGESPEWRIWQTDDLLKRYATHYPYEEYCAWRENGYKTGE